MIYCCACGVNIGGVFYPETFDLDEDEIAQLYDKEQLPEEQIEWTWSGFCFINEKSFDIREDLQAPKGELVNIQNCKPDYDSTDLLPDLAGPDSFFPFHLACISLVDRFVGRKLPTRPGERVSSLQTVQHFYGFLDSLRPFIREDPDGIIGKGIEWKHGYYGARRFWFDGWRMERGWKFLVANPFDIPNLTEYLLSNLEHIPVTNFSRPRMYDQNPLKKISHAALDTLPVELLDRIITRLPISSILCLHRTNRTLAKSITLDQRFWRDQIISGNLVPFLWDLDSTACRSIEDTVPENTCWDWKTLAFNISQEPFLELALKDALHEPLAMDLGRRHLGFWEELGRGAESKLKGSPPLGLVNRVRIMRIIEEATLLAEDGHSDALSGGRSLSYLL